MRTLDRRSFLALSAGFVGAGAIPGLLPRARAAGLRLGRADTFFTWHELRPGVHAAVDASMGGNVMAVISGGKVLLVDTKFPAFAAALARETEALGGTLATVVNTHHHADHTGGNAVLNPRAEIVAHAKVAERVAAQLERYVGGARGGPRQIEMQRPGAEQVLEEAQAAAEAAPNWTGDDFAPDVKLDAWPHEMSCAEVKLALHHFGPGHTDNDVVVHLPDANVLHAGDLCFHKLHPFFDPDGGATCRGWSESVAEAIELCDAETVVVPGHGEITDRAGLEAQKRYLDELWDRVAKEIRLGKARDEVVAMRWDFMEGLGFEQVRERAIGAVYDELKRGG